MGILTEDMKRVVREQSLGFVATVCADGSPNLSPKGTLSVWDDDQLIFADIASPITMANLVTNPTVEVNVVDPVRRTGYRFKGRALVHTDGPMFEQALRYFESERGIEAGRIRRVAIIAIERASALISPAYSRGATEHEVSERFAVRLEEIHGWKIDRPEAER